MPTQGEPPTKREKTYTREEFKKLVLGKTKEEVIKLIGKPNRTKEDKYLGEYCLVWQYDGIAKDKDAIELDPITQLWLGDYSDPKNVKVSRINSAPKPKR